MADLSNLPPTIGGLRQANARLLKALQKERQRAGDYKQERNEARERLEFASVLLDRVVIHGGSGAWSWREMSDWCCDYKDFKNGHMSAGTVGHDNCGHRKSPSTACGAIGPGDSDEPVHHLFGPYGLWQRAERAERERDEAREQVYAAHQEVYLLWEWNGACECLICTQHLAAQEGSDG